MAKKKHQQNPHKPKEFHADPFGKLKGVVLAEAEPVKVVEPVVKKVTESADDALDIFLREVADVRPLKTKTQKAAPVTAPPLQKKAQQAVEKNQALEENTFLEEIGRLKLDTKFTDVLPGEDELQPLAGNRLRQVRRGIVSVGHQLDLHGLTREEALEALPGFLQSAQKKGQKAVLIITGKGNHSLEEPVLHQAVASWLRDAGRNMVLEFAPAPREMGGSGAYIVFLRPLTSSVKTD